MNVAELVRSLGIEVREAGESPHVTGGWLGIVCPFCGRGTSKYGLGINLRYGNCSCWKCGVHSLKEVLVELGVPWQEARRLLAGLERGLPPEERPRGKLVLPAGLGPLQPIHKEFLASRGLDPAECERLWGVQGIGLATRLAWRVWIPVVWRGKTVSWTARAIGSHPIRYASARPEEEAVPARSLLFGEDYCRHAAVVCEGPLDAMTVGPGAVATLGVSWTRSQAARLAKFPVRVICFDAEPAAQTRAERLCGDLAAFPGRTVRVALETGKDPSRASRGEVRRLRRLYLGE